MEILETYFLAAAAMILVFGLAAAWSWRHRGIRWPMVIGTAVLGIGVYFAAYDLLSRPKPVEREWLSYRIGKVEVLGMKVEPGSYLGVYVFSRQHWERPRSYILQWNEETKQIARKLQQAMAAQRKRGGRIMMYPFAQSLEEEEPIVQHELPFPELPPKTFESPDQRKAPRKFEI